MREVMMWRSFYDDTTGSITCIEFTDRYFWLEFHNDEYRPLSQWFWKHLNVLIRFERLPTSKSDNVDKLIRFEADILDQRAKSSVVLQLARGRVAKAPSHHEFAPYMTWIGIHIYQERVNTDHQSLYINEPQAPHLGSFEYECLSEWMS